MMMIGVCIKIGRPARPSDFLGSVKGNRPVYSGDQGEKGGLLISYTPSISSLCEMNS